MRFVSVLLITNFIPVQTVTTDTSVWHEEHGEALVYLKVYDQHFAPEAPALPGEW